MIDKNGRIFGKISIIDLIILILIFVLGIGVYLKANSGEINTVIAANDVFYTTFKVSKVRSFSVDAVSEGDIFYEKHAAKIGEVVNVVSMPAKDILVKDDGTSVEADVIDREDLYITLKCTGRVNDRGYYLNGNRQLNTGSDLTIKSNNITFSARVSNISSEY